MNTTTATATFDTLKRAEQLLASAGFTFTVVGACPHPGCEVCTAQPVPAAA